MNKIIVVIIWTLNAGVIALFLSMLAIMYLNQSLKLESFTEVQRYVVIAFTVIGMVIGGFTGNTYYDQKNEY